MADTASEETTAPPPPQGDGVLTPAFLRTLADALDESDAAQIKSLVDPLHPADFAALLSSMDPNGRRELVAALGAQIDPDVLLEVDENLRDELVRLIGPKTLAKAVKEFDVEDAAYVLEDLADAEKREALAETPLEERAEVLAALLYPDDSAGRLMHREFVALPGALTAREALAKLTKVDTPDEFQEIYLIDDQTRPTGVVALSRLIRAEPAAKLADIASSEIKIIPATSDRREFAYLFEHYHLSSAPVTDEQGRLVGLLSAGAIVEVLQEMHQAEVLALGGVTDEESFSATIVKTTYLRFSWLFVNLLTAIAASIVIGFFERSLEKIVALAILMPIVASMGGNAGTQTLTVVVRALATKELNRANFWRIVRREMIIGALNGVGFAFLAAAITYVWFNDLLLSGVIAAAMTINLLAAAFAGILVPVGLTRMDVDPAVSSPVFVTTVTDVVGFLSFLGLATWILLR